jgi:hypothetical protein
MKSVPGLIKSHFQQSSEQNNRKLISLHNNGEVDDNLLQIKFAKKFAELK